MASLRFNYNGTGDKRAERNRSNSRGMMTRRTPFIYANPFLMPPRPQPSPQPRKGSAVPEPAENYSDLPESPAKTEPSKTRDMPVSQETVPQETAAQAQLPQEPVGEIPLQGPEEGEKGLPKDVLEQPEPVAQLPEGPVAGVSERFIASLESYENGMVKLRQHVDTSKIVLDEILFQMDSFLKILDVLRENEERKLKQPQASIVMQKDHKDTIDEVLELLQTPAVQNILRQVLIGVLVKK